MLTFILLLTPLLAGLLLLIFFPMTLPSYQGAFLLLSALFVASHLVLFTNTPLWTPLASVAAGEGSHVVMIGVLGEKAKVKDFQSILCGVGLFPWLYDWRVSLLYIGLFFFFAVALAMIRVRRGTSTNSFSSLKKAAAGSDGLTGSLNLAFPLLASGVASLGALVFLNL